MDDILKSINMRASKLSASPTTRSSFDAKGTWSTLGRKASGAVGPSDNIGASSDALEVTPREDSVISAWRTVSEIESILGTEYRPTEGAHSPPTGLDENAIQALNSQVDAALHVSLSFKDRIEESSKVFRWSKSHRASQRSTEEDFSIGGALEPPAIASQIATPKFQAAAFAAAAPAAQQPPAAAPAGFRKPPGLSLQVAAAPAPAAVPAAAAAAGGGPGGGPGFKKPALGGLGLQLQVGSSLPQGEWATNGVWKATDANEGLIPPHLQQIHADDLVKVKELGRGCFGSVWLQKWRGVDVAVKEMLQSGNDTSPAEVYSEAEKLASMRHPCVVAFYGIVVQPGSYATVLEYVRNGSLRSGLGRIKKQGLHIVANLDARKVRANIALQAARGMEYLHAQSMVHFDLKCDNLLCDLRDLGRPVVKIGDLGLSKRKRESFISGNMRGTLPWMAPELFPSVPGAMASMAASMNHRDKVNEKVDVFSFGVVLWEVWTFGDQPYPSLSLQEIFAGVMTGNLRPAVPADCDPAWAQLMHDCWQGKPRMRPTFGEIAQRLEAMVQQ